MTTTWTVLLLTAAVMFSIALDLALWAQRLPTRRRSRPEPQHNPDCGFPR